MKIKKLTTILLAFSILSGLGAQDEKGFSLSGTVDAYYRLNISGDFDEAPATSFANLPGFSLGMANLIASYEGDKVGFTADVVLGPRGEDATFLSSALRPGGSSNIVNQLYVYYNVSEKVTFTLGNFNTFLGYEVISPAGNFNYSTSYLFSYGPFSHTGLKMDADLGNGLSLMVGVFNPTDATEYNPTNDFFGGAQLGYAFGAGSVYLNTLFGDGYFQIDLTGGVNLSEKVYFGVNASSASDDLFSGAAAYLQAATSDNFKIGLRGEYFVDNGVGAITPGEDVLAFTVSGNYTINNLTIIPEIRADMLSYDGFGLENEMNSSLTSFLLAVVYSF